MLICKESNICVYLFNLFFNDLYMFWAVLWDSSSCWFDNFQVLLFIFFNIGTLFLIVFCKTHCAVPHKRATLGRNQHSAWLATVFLLFIQTMTANLFCTVGKKNARNVVYNTAGHLLPLSHSHWKQRLFDKRRPDLNKYINRVSSQCCRPLYRSSFWVFNASNGHRLCLFLV